MRRTDDAYHTTMSNAVKAQNNYYKNCVNGKSYFFFAFVPLRL